mmetsp:Transcript_102342/g.285136  ORF Transcript_102342/g.285136 Transcript_102342/m.285136 type:complete len:206 (+) Transcript_102342:37-654(+)|eukprot:CAMPEP_0179074576 /NCGR_PEP_ID=MMETSP0796-20121207/33156_1 /TAXON_ID=73915 /ORGANISM="Pyrodinium bahamense, Strain pbaha01" /LENGTH=205 /DNA_ID=CAMNT_0020771801 /DNA_START=37 /DNA_END=654 /DNA_ORIENTATION=+
MCLLPRAAGCSSGGGPRSQNAAASLLLLRPSALEHVQLCLQVLPVGVHQRAHPVLPGEGHVLPQHAFGLEVLPVLQVTPDKLCHGARDLVALEGQGLELRRPLHGYGHLAKHAKGLLLHLPRHTFCGLLALCGGKGLQGTAKLFGRSAGRDLHTALSRHAVRPGGRRPNFELGTLLQFWLHGYDEREVSADRPAALAEALDAVQC